jgi:hypothetical protein
MLYWAGAAFRRAPRFPDDITAIENGQGQPAAEQE